jgi:hypothetical protein
MATWAAGEPKIAAQDGVLDRLTTRFRSRQLDQDLAPGHPARDSGAAGATGASPDDAVLPTGHRRRAAARDSRHFPGGAALPGPDFA